MTMHFDAIKTRIQTKEVNDVYNISKNCSLGSCHFEYLMRLTHLSLASHKRDIGKQWTQNQTPHYAVSDQGLHCLHFVQLFLQNMIIIKTNQSRLIQEMDLSKELR